MRLDCAIAVVKKYRRADCAGTAGQQIANHEEKNPMAAMMAASTAVGSEKASPGKPPQAGGGVPSSEARVDSFTSHIPTGGPKDRTRF